MFRGPKGFFLALALVFLALVAFLVISLAIIMAYGAFYELVLFTGASEGLSALVAWIPTFLLCWMVSK